MKFILWNMFSKIQNAQLANKKVVFQKKKKVCESFLNVLWDEGYISGYTIDKQNDNLIIFLKYHNNKPVIKKIKCISKPGSRIFYTIKQLWKIDSSKNFLILSTNKGLKTLNECKKLNIGGEPFITVI